MRAALATALEVRPERLLLEATSGSVVVRVSIVDGAPGEPTAAQAVGTLKSLHTAGELQQKLADGGVTDVLDASQPPVSFLAPDGDSPSPSPSPPPPSFGGDASSSPLGQTADAGAAPIGVIVGVVAGVVVIVVVVAVVVVCIRRKKTPADGTTSATKTLAVEHAFGSSKTIEVKLEQTSV